MALDRSSSATGIKMSCPDRTTLSALDMIEQLSQITCGHHAGSSTTSTDPEAMNAAAKVMKQSGDARALDASAFAQF